MLNLYNNKESVQYLMSISSVLFNKFNTVLSKKPGRVNSSYFKTSNETVYSHLLRPKNNSSYIHFL